MGYIFFYVFAATVVMLFGAKKAFWRGVLVTLTLRPCEVFLLSGRRERGMVRGGSVVRGEEQTIRWTKRQIEQEEETSGGEGRVWFFFFTILAGVIWKTQRER